MKPLVRIILGRKNKDHESRVTVPRVRIKVGLGSRGHGSKGSRIHRSRGHRSCIKRVTDQVAKVKGLKIFGGSTSTIILSISFHGYFH